MQAPKLLSIAVAVAVIMSLATVAAMGADGPAAADTTARVHAAALRGPLAEPAAVAGPAYGLFSCQVGLSTGQCYDPYQMRHAYGIDTLVNAGFDGTGKTIVIIDAFQSPNIGSQLNFFNSFYGIPASNFTIIEPPGGSTPFDPNTMAGWAEEISLDVLWAHAIAPGASIVLELAKDNSDVALLSALNDAINNNRGDVVSMSFGESDTCLGPDLVAAWHQAFVNATAKGITLFASSGDEGAAQPSCDGNSWIQSTSSPASDPLVTGVGGTELTAADYCLAALGCDPSTHPAPGTYLSEIGWNEGPPYGDFQANFGSTLSSGGGYSTVWGEPPYQQGTIHGGKKRGSPDVSYNAAVLHGVLTYLNIPTTDPNNPIKGWYRFGGTSAGSPQWAALTAIFDQAAGHDFGFINSALFKIGQSGGQYANAFHGITTGTNAAVEFDALNSPVDIDGFNAGTDWDAVTGLGTPKAVGLLSELATIWSAGQGKAATANSTPHGKSGSRGNAKPN